MTVTMPVSNRRNRGFFRISQEYLQSDSHAELVALFRNFIPVDMEMNDLNGIVTIYGFHPEFAEVECFEEPPEYEAIIERRGEAFRVTWSQREDARVNFEASKTDNASFQSVNPTSPRSNPRNQGTASTMNYQTAPHRFWLVKGEGAASFHHYTRESAEREADRLAQENPGVHFYVMEATAAHIHQPVTRINLEHDEIPF